MENRTYREALNWASSFLESHDVTAQTAEYYLIRLKKWSKTELLLNLNEVITSTDYQQFVNGIKRIAQHYPVQYLLGSEEFFGRNFKVNQATLIPRPETEELVERILQSYPKNDSLTVVDIGTGTGIIGITLKKERPNWHVICTDVMPETLGVAKENADILNVKIDFRLGDLLEPIKHEQVDVLISNPPYIGQTEWQTMDESVLKFEPHVALFAEDEGYDLYKRLANDAPTILNENGQIFLEIGYLQGASVKAMFQNKFPQKSVDILKDMSGQDRMIHVY